MTDKEVIWNSLHGVEGDSDKGPEKELVEAIDIDGFTCLDLGFNYGWWSWLFLKHIGKKAKSTPGNLTNFYMRTIWQNGHLRIS